MHYSNIKLPTEKNKLIACYLYLSSQLRSLWVEYVSMAEEINGPTCTEIYRIIFAEMDFYEGLRQRVANKLPPKLLVVLRNVDDYSSW